MKRHLRHTKKCLHESLFHTAQTEPAECGECHAEFDLGDRKAVVWPHGRRQPGFLLCAHCYRDHCHGGGMPA